MVTIQINVGVGDEQGRFEIETGTSFSFQEKASTIGAFPKLRSFAKQAPVLSRRLRLEVHRNTVQVTREGEEVPESELLLVRRKLLYLIEEAEKQLLLP